MYASASSGAAPVLLPEPWDIAHRVPVRLLTERVFAARPSRS